MADAVQRGLEGWYRFFNSHDVAVLREIVHPDVMFHSPSGHNPYGGQLATVTALSTVMTIFENFQYHREFVDAEAQSVVLEFSAQIEGRDLKGFDVIRFDDDGRIVEFEVAIRPLAMVARLAELMGQKTGAIMSDLKVKRPA